MSIEPCFLLWTEFHGLRDNGPFVLQVQSIVELRVFDEPNVCLLSGKIVFARDEISQEPQLLLVGNCFPEGASRQNYVASDGLFVSEGLILSLWRGIKAMLQEPWPSFLFGRDVVRLGFGRRGQPPPGFRSSYLALNIQGTIALLPRDYTNLQPLMHLP